MFCLFAIAAAYAEDSVPPADPAFATVGAPPVPVPANEEIVVTAERPAGPNPSATSASVTVLTPDARTAGSADVAAMIDSAAGTNVQRLGGLGDFAAVSIRGASLRQVEVFLDGVPLNPDGADVVNLSELPLGAFSRIEVWRGNAPVSFGASPIGGVVNLVTREGSGGRGGVAFGSWDTARGDVYGAGALSPPPAEAGGGGRRPEGGTRPLSGQLFFDALSTRDDFEYFADNSTIYNVLDDHVERRGNNDKLQFSGFARGRAVLGDWRLSLADVPLFRDEGLPGTANLPADEARLTTTRNLSVAQLEGCGSTWAGTATLWHLWRAEELVDESGQLDGTHRHELDELGTAGMRLNAGWAPAAWIQPNATIGVRSESITINDLAGDQSEPERTRLAGSVALSADLRLFAERLTLSPVVALEGIDNRELGGSSASQSGSAADAAPFVGAVNPRLGVLVRPTRWLALKGNGGRYFRPPDLVEMFGNHGTLEGNSELLPETGWQADVGTRIEAPTSWAITGTFDAAAFWLVSEDRIVWVQNSQKSFTPVNFGDTWVQGVEGALVLGAFSVLDSETNVTWQLSRNLTVGSNTVNNELPRTPPLAVWQSTSVHWQERVRVGHTFSYTAPNYWDAGNLYQSAPRSIHGLFVRTQPTPKWPNVEVAVLNLTDTITEVVPRNPADPTDTSRAVSAVTDFAGYPLPGRTLMFSARWEL
ncbi:TonB-dependent receptor [Deltaproteobacteria bacterium]|nr:TonB-dependent receptor [Deltaproteobacteria bacterium]